MDGLQRTVRDIKLDLPAQHIPKDRRVHGLGLNYFLDVTSPEVAFLQWFRWKVVFLYLVRINRQKVKLQVCRGVEVLG